ncbi:hypothetical protein BDN70DRAFT_939570 [Pholiota conissans]|uniref:Uncharacterized protein n=1 Tax=Pholiota conissans TaxID=109636 RepID=A0A9P5YIQ5_9AGAR|nr:hypothetical protein BDN70DRAFT_939570 [Pholiota conissans]
MASSSLLQSVRCLRACVVFVVVHLANRSSSFAVGLVSSSPSVVVLSYTVRPILPLFFFILARSMAVVLAACPSLPFVASARRPPSSRGRPMSSYASSVLALALATSSPPIRSQFHRLGSTSASVAVRDVRRWFVVVRERPFILLARRLSIHPLLARIRRHTYPPSCSPVVVAR